MRCKVASAVCEYIEKKMLIEKRFKLLFENTYYAANLMNFLNNETLLLKLGVDTTSVTIQY